MKKIIPITELENAIRLLEEEQAIKGQKLKEQFFVTYRSLKPAVLLGGTLKEMVSSPYLIENILSTAMSLGTGYLAKKVVVGASGNIVRKLVGSALQFGVSNVVSKHSGSIGSFGQALVRHFLHKKENKTKKT